MPRLILLPLLLLAACAMPPPATVDPNFSQLVAQATATRAAVNVASTQSAAQATSDTMLAAQHAAITATAASVKATSQSAMVTATVYAQETAVVRATESAYQQSREEIELAALEERTELITQATRQAILLDIEQGNNKASIMRWFWPAMAFIVLTAVSGISYAIYRTLIRNSNTVRDSNGEVISYRGHFLLPESIAPPVIDDNANGGHATHNSAGGPRGFDKYRQPKNLEDESGRLVYQFSGRQLDSLERNIQNGDIGFRRDTSNQGEGLDDLIGMKNRQLFSNILDEMKRRGYVRPHGNGHVWTERGMREFLDMSTLPHFN